MFKFMIEEECYITQEDMKRLTSDNKIVAAEYLDAVVEQVSYALRDTIRDAVCDAIAEEKCKQEYDGPDALFDYIKESTWDADAKMNGGTADALMERIEKAYEFIDIKRHEAKLLSQIMYGESKCNVTWDSDETTNDLEKQGMFRCPKCGMNFTADIADDQVMVVCTNGLCKHAWLIDSKVRELR